MKFLKKYKLIIFLVAVIFILAFFKGYFKNDSTTTTSIETTKQVSPTGKNTTGNTSLILNEELIEKYESLGTDEEKNTFWETLSEEQQTYLSGEEATEEYNLESNLPYETDTFMVSKYLDMNTLSVKMKGSDFNKSKSDLENWLNETADNPEEIVLVWQEN
ncbi:MAG: hypothetical protein WDA13_00630 [Candidatus Shapirobacteria bacterium]